MELVRSNRRVLAIVQSSFCYPYPFQPYSSSGVTVFTFSVWSWMRSRLEKTTSASLTINWLKCQAKEHSKTKETQLLTILNCFSSLIMQRITTSASYVWSSTVIPYFILADTNVYASPVDKSSCNRLRRKYALCVETELKTLLKFIDEVI